jgi:hypothetical protein
MPASKPGFPRIDKRRAQGRRIKHSLGRNAQILHRVAHDPRKPQVKVLSVQSSTGLEFRSVIFIGPGQTEISETHAARNMKLLCRMPGNSFRHRAATTGHDPRQGTADDHGFGKK